MRKNIHIFGAALSSVLMICCQEKSLPDTNTKVQTESDLSVKLVEERVTSIENLIANIGDAVPNKERQIIEKRGLQYLENKFDWNDFKYEDDLISLHQAFAAVGVYSREERQNILQQNILFYLQGEKWAVENMAKESRLRWKRQDGVIPPVRNDCPSCGGVMKLMSMGNEYDRKYPEAWIFTGECAQGHYYMYDQKNGWRVDNSTGEGSREGSREGSV